MQGILEVSESLVWDEDAKTEVLFRTLTESSASSAFKISLICNISMLNRLTFLDMSYNQLEAIPFGSLRGHPTLEHFNLDHNRIHLIDREAFVAMPALRELRLKNNSLSNHLHLYPFWNLPELKGLDLSDNFFRLFIYLSIFS